MINELLNMPLTWILMTLALMSYMHLFVLWFNCKTMYENEHKLNSQFEAYNFNKAVIVTKIIISTLPLVGLLGTVMGMQESFSALVYDTAKSYAVTKGISTAMLTTLLGLFLAIPGWILLVKIQTVYQHYHHCINQTES